MAYGESQASGENENGALRRARARARSGIKRKDKSSIMASRRGSSGGVA
jgi:hypothetical protein